MFFDTEFFIQSNIVPVSGFLMILIFLVQNREMDRRSKIRFVSLGIICVIESVASSIESMISNGDTYYYARTVTSVIGYIARPLILYMVFLMMSRNYSVRSVRLLFGIPLMILTPLTMTALTPGVNIVFTIRADENNFDRGPLGWLPAFVLAFYFVTILVVGFVNYRKSRWECISVFLGIFIVAFDFYLETGKGYSNVTIREAALTLSVIIYYMYFQSQIHYDEEQESEIKRLDDLNGLKDKMLDDIINTLSDTIDLKDKYTQGHSDRVAEYSVMIGKTLGLKKGELTEIYRCGLLHDVGKIGIPENIINKPGALSAAEFDIIKTHPERGAAILSRIEDMPYLRLGALYHHERYDGTGYPEGLRGNDIPLVGRIIAVADAYDAMTSKRSYRDPLPQPYVREQFIRGSGTQFDPELARIMVNLIDKDKEFKLQEKTRENGISNREYICTDWWSEKTDGVRVSDHPLTVSYTTKTNRDAGMNWDSPSVIVFDSSDGRVGRESTAPGVNDYHEFAVIRSDAYAWKTEARALRYENSHEENWSDWEDWMAANKTGTRATVTAVRYEDHVLVELENNGQKVKATIALPDNCGQVYISLTGEHCTISEINISYADRAVGAGFIEPIEEKYAVTKANEGDVPNIECEGWWSEFSQGFEITEEKLRIRYHSISYASAKRIWHTPLTVIFTSNDHNVDGDGYIQYEILRSDGECWGTEAIGKPKSELAWDEKFKDWSDWMAKNKEGVNCEVVVYRQGDTVYTEMKNTGITVSSEFVLPVRATGAVCLALTGELCALTDIHVEREEKSAL